VDMPERGVRDWLTREEAARALGKTPRTVDRLLARGRLVRQGEGVPVKVSKESVERVAGEQLAAVRPVPEIKLPQDSYDAMRLKMDRLEAQLRDRDQALLTWEGQVAALEAAIEEERTARTDAEAVAEQERQERERLAAELEAERSRGFWSRLFGGGSKK